MDNNVFLAVKAAIVAFAGAFSAAFGWLGWLIVAWVFCMVVDYISEMSKALIHITRPCFDHIDNGREMEKLM